MENQCKKPHCLGDSTCATNVLSPEANNSSILDMTQNTADLCIYEGLEMPGECTEGEMSGDHAEREVDTANSSQVDSKPASQIDDPISSCSLNAEDLAACQASEDAKAREEICLSEVLSNEALSLSHITAPLESQTCGLKDSSENANNDSEILPGRTFITADDSYVDDCLQVLECSDVMTEESYQQRQRELKFLLESDDDDELTLGKVCDGCAYFLGEMPRLCPVSDNTQPMDASIGFCGHPSKPKEVAVRSSLAACNPSLLPTGMTLTVGHQQSEAPTLKDKEKRQQPVASMAIENDYPRIKEENKSHGQSAEDSPVDGSRGMESQLLGMEPSSCSLSGSSVVAEKPKTERNSSRTKSHKFAKGREKGTKGGGRDDAAGPAKASKSLLNKLHSRDRHVDERRTIHGERSCLDSAELLRGCNCSDPNGVGQDTSKSPTHYGSSHGKTSLRRGERISSLSGGNQLPNENGALTAKRQEMEAETSVHMDNELFIAEPKTEDGLVPASSSPAKNLLELAEIPALEEATGEKDLQANCEVLENSINLYLPTHAPDKGEPNWTETHQATIMDNTVSPDVFLPRLDHTPSISHPEAFCDILTPEAVPDRPMERGTVCSVKPHEINEVKTTDDSLCAEHLSKVAFQTALECSEPAAKEADLSLVHEQLQRLLYDEGWGYDFTPAGGEVKSLAAGSDPAKEPEGLNVTGDASAGRLPVPGHLTEDNQLVTELATALGTVTEAYRDSDGLLGTDETCSSASLSTSSLALPVEADVSGPIAVFGHSSEEPSGRRLRSSLSGTEVYLDDDQRQAQSGDRGPVQTSASLEGKITTENASASLVAESPFGLAEAQRSPLKRGQVVQVEGFALYLGQSLYTKPDIHGEGDAMAKQADETPAKNSHVRLCQSRIKDGANLPELSPKEEPSNNFSGKNADQFTCEGRSSVTGVDEKCPEKGTELDVDPQSDIYCGSDHVLTGGSSVDFHTTPDAGNYTYHMQEHNSMTVIASIANWDGPEDAEIKEVVFKASHKSKHLSQVPLGSDKNEESPVNHERTDCSVIAELNVPKSESEIPLPDSQQRISGGKSKITAGVCAIEKEVEMHITGLTPDSGTTAASMMGNERSNSGQDSQGAGRIVGMVERNQEDLGVEYSTKAMVVGSFRTESVHSKAEKDLSEQTSQQRPDLYQRLEEDEKGGHIPQYEGDPGQREIPVAHEYEYAEVETYMRALLDFREPIHSWLESSEPETKEHRKPKGEKQTQVSSCEERDNREHQAALKCHLEEVEVEPYMRALMTSEENHSWHESINYVYPSRGETGVIIRACTGASASHSRSSIFTAEESKNLKRLENNMEASVNVVSYSSEKSKLSRAAWAPSSPEDVKHKQETVKKKMVSKGQVKKPRLETKEKALNSTSSLKKASKVETGQKEEKRVQRKPPSEKDSKAPKLLKKIQAELFPDFSGNIKLCCQFIEIHEDAIITWTKDSQLLARVQRSAGDEFPVSLAIVQAGKKDQGLYCCCVKNRFGKATADFNLTPEVLEHLASFQDVEGLEEIEFLQLMFREDFICDSYFGSSLQGRITTEELHFGEGVHRKAFRSKVMQGLVPVFSPGHPCVLKVHNAIAYGTKNNDELVKKNYKLAMQECCIQNTAREYAKIYASEAEQFEGFGEVPEIIPIFLIHRPKSNIPYATVEEELIGEFVKYSVRDGKEINFTRKDSEAGQKCCTFQHWVFERTSGSLLITDMQGVGMKLTDVGIATLAKGYKGFKGNCSISFIDQFKALHQCNKYCEMLGLRALQSSGQKLRKPPVPKPKTQQPSSSTVKKTGVVAQVAKKT
ncbi:alpha-protein kinase 2 [Paroedura picta]|uniref:alpha-protein kinase 2 n=1 Tax=Paroedura picta TaxID=143630 RepID=UPI004056C4A2